MKIDIIYYLPSNLLSEFSDNDEPPRSLDIEDKLFDRGAQGDIYRVIDDDNNYKVYLVKLFRKGFPPYLQDIIKEIRDYKDRSSVYNCKALRALPLFIFEGELKKEIVYGYVMRHVGGKSLDNIINTEEELNIYQNIPLKDRLQLCLQFAEGMSILYALRIVHGDINSKNIMIDIQHKKLAIIDIDGGAVTRRGSSPNMVKLTAWLAYEIWDQFRQQSQIDMGFSADFWSLACGIHYLLFGLNPYFFIKGRPHIKNYLHKNRWNEIPQDREDIKDIIIESQVKFFDDYNKTYSRLSKQLQQHFEISFQDCYLNKERRISPYLWMSAIEEQLKTISPPILNITKKKFTFFDINKDSTKTDRFIISNIGDDILRGDVTTNKEWLRLQHYNKWSEKTKFEINKYDSKLKISFCIYTFDLPFGFKDTGSIEIVSNGGNEKIYIDLSVETRTKKIKKYIKNIFNP